MRAHLHGGIPKSEVEAKQAVFEAHGFEPARLLKKHAKASDYFDFAVAVKDKTDVKKRIETDEGVVAKEQALADAVEGWWKKHKKVLAEAVARTLQDAPLPCRAGKRADGQVVFRPRATLAA